MTPLPPAPVFSQDTLIPDRRTLVLIGLFLRLGLGIAILNAGLISYLQQSGFNGGGRGGFGSMFFGGPQPSFGQAFEAIKLLPYVEIAVGVALILGFFTGWAVLLAMAIQIFVPLVQTVLILLYHGQGNMNGMFGVESMFPSSRLVTLLFGALVLWLCPAHRNPFSVDSLVFRPSFNVLPREPRPPGGLEQGSAAAPARVRQDRGTDRYLDPKAAGADPETRGSD